jgi:hypothetical protein
MEFMDQVPCTAAHVLTARALSSTTRSYCCELVRLLRAILLLVNTAAHLAFIRCELVHTGILLRARSYLLLRADAAAARLTAGAAAARADQSRLETQFILRRRRLTNYTMSHGGPDEGEEAGNQGDTWPDKEDASPAPAAAAACRHKPYTS